MGIKFPGCECISTVGMSRDDWLAERMHSLGGSDMGAILGFNPYTSPFTVWADKCGKLPEREDNEAMRQGRDLESYVVERFEERSGLKAERVNAIIRRKDAPYLHANIDRRIQKQKSGLECKTASALNTRAFTGGEFPLSYYAQCVCYLAITGYERWYLAALILGKEFKVYRITTIQDEPLPEWCESSVYVSKDEITALMDAAQDFWIDHVLKEIPPCVDGTKSTSESIKTIFKDGGGAEMELFGFDKDLENYHGIKESIAILEQQKTEIENRIKMQMQDSEKAYCGRYKVSWKPQAGRKSFSVQSLAHDHPEIDISKYYEVGNPTRPFSIKEDNKK